MFGFFLFLLCVLLVVTLTAIAGVRHLRQRRAAPSTSRSFEGYLFGMHLVERLYNPSERRCGCPPECVCQRNALGRAFRWYIPVRFHTPVPSEDKDRLAAAGLSFREP